MTDAAKARLDAAIERMRKNNREPPKVPKPKPHRLEAFPSNECRNKAKWTERRTFMEWLRGWLYRMGLRA